MFLLVMEPVQFQVKKSINSTIQCFHLSIICIETTATLCFCCFHFYDLDSTQRVE